MPRNQNKRSSRTTNVTRASHKNKPASRSASRAAQPRIKVRMYRQGLGDCFLLTLPKADGGNFYILIDCGVVLGTPEASARMTEVVKDILTVTKRIDLLVATHEHWDHVSGFLQARDLFKQLTFDQVWLAWTEDPEDKLAKELRGEHNAMRAALAASSARMRIGARGDDRLDSILEFFGARGRGSTTDALNLVKGFCDKTRIRYCRASDEPVTLPGTSAKVYVLGPPHDKKMIMRYNPSKAHPETYGLSPTELRAAFPSESEATMDAPFDNIQQIPWAATQGISFFQQHYWATDPSDPEEGDQSWRRIDSEWLDQARSLALKLDNATNNTSLALAIELDGGEVLLFAADAQVGNWLSWQDLAWKDAHGKTVTGPDLLKRTVLYKTGHHGSHNATLKEKGLEQMIALRWALIPVDHKMAKKKGWPKMPLEELEDTLKEKTQGRMIRIDHSELPPAAAEGGAVMTKDYIEVAI